MDAGRKNDFMKGIAFPPTGKPDGFGEALPNLSLVNLETDNTHQPAHSQPLNFQAFPYVSPAGPFYIGSDTSNMSHPMNHLQTMGMEKTTLLPLPTEQADEEPIYVNAKQYHAILRRRKRRKISGPEDETATIQKRQANMRPRGAGGRFISTNNPVDPSGCSTLSCPSTVPAKPSHLNILAGEGFLWQNCHN
ncbi:hypothetical protein GUJ93_ZPchr0012g21270 [Zizania palustris]|uniref:Nuclear transcription factor Y subunit n=1 Tax=Zizania palustris TaxID=103762 RepID=A0A8J5WY33_ZIZPA|nr:hypothetical protein GUJ93_ZPchr0012g21270 [Zizania palustris]